MQNDHLVLITGHSGTGKSSCLRTLKNPEGVMYLNCESGKKLPFKSKFQEFTITNPLQVQEAFTHAETKEDIHTIIIDSISMLLEQYESQFVLTAPNTMKAWSDYHQFFKKLMQNYVAKSTKNIIFTSHLQTILNEEEMTSSVQASCKGALKNTGIEAYFSTVVSTKKVPVKKLPETETELLCITERDQAVQYKHCFQTQITKDTVNERIRGPLGLFEENEIFIDADAQKLLDRLHSYYE